MSKKDQKLVTKVEELENQLKRAVADYRNLEQRVNESRLEMSSWATAELISRLLPVLDHLEKALEGATAEERESGWFKGVQMAVKQLQQVLEGEGLEQIVADGQFDPALHEAVDIRVGEENKIMEVAKKGYKLKGKVLVPAQVVVGRKEGQV